VRLARELRPDIVVMDISMPRLDGISAARAIQLATPICTDCLSLRDRDTAEAP
jgi:DNA-binding NarL/FixJ family response regulator